LPDLLVLTSEGFILTSEGSGDLKPPINRQTTENLYGMFMDRISLFILSVAEGLMHCNSNPSRIFS